MADEQDKQDRRNSQLERRDDSDEPDEEMATSKSDITEEMQQTEVNESQEQDSRESLDGKRTVGVDPSTPREEVEEEVESQAFKAQPGTRCCDTKEGKSLELAPPTLAPPREEVEKSNDVSDHIPNSSQRDGQQEEPDSDIECPPPPT